MGAIFPDAASLLSALTRYSMTMVSDLDARTAMITGQIERLERFRVTVDSLFTIKKEERDMRIREGIPLTGLLLEQLSTLSSHQAHVATVIDCSHKLLYSLRNEMSPETEEEWKIWYKFARVSEFRVQDEIQTRTNEIIKECDEANKKEEASEQTEQTEQTEQ